MICVRLQSTNLRELKARTTGDHPTQPPDPLRSASLRPCNASSTMSITFANLKAWPAVELAATMFKNWISHHPPMHEGSGRLPKETYIIPVGTPQCPLKIMIFVAKPKRGNNSCGVLKDSADSDVCTFCTCHHFSKARKFARTFWNRDTVGFRVWNFRKIVWLVWRTDVYGCTFLFCLREIISKRPSRALSSWPSINNTYLLWGIRCPHAEERLPPRFTRTKTQVTLKPSAKKTSQINSNVSTKTKRNWSGKQIGI